MQIVGVDIKWCLWMCIALQEETEGIWDREAGHWGNTQLSSGTCRKPPCVILGQVFSPARCALWRVPVHWTALQLLWRGWRRLGMLCWGSGDAARCCGGTTSTRPPALWHRGRMELPPAGAAVSCMGLDSGREDVPATISKKGREILLPLWMLEVLKRKQYRM